MTAASSTRTPILPMTARAAPDVPSTPVFPKGPVKAQSARKAPMTAGRSAGTTNFTVPHNHGNGGFFREMRACGASSTSDRVNRPSKRRLRNLTSISTLQSCSVRIYWLCSACFQGRTCLCIASVSCLEHVTMFAHYIGGFGGQIWRRHIVGIGPFECYKSDDPDPGLHRDGLIRASKAQISRTDHHQRLTLWLVSLPLAQIVFLGQVRAAQGPALGQALVHQVKRGPTSQTLAPPAAPAERGAPHRARGSAARQPRGPASAPCRLPQACCRHHCPRPPRRWDSR